MQEMQQQKRNRLALRRAALLAGISLLVTASAFPQDEARRGSIELGVRVLAGDRDSSKFEEYRHIPKGFYIQNFRLHLDELFGKSYFFSFQTRETLERDQGYLLRAGRSGKFRFDLRWDQTPHLFTNSARIPFSEPQPGVFTLPATVRTALQARPEDFAALVADSPALGIPLRRFKGGGAFLYTPTTDWSFRVEYSREKLTGLRPFGTTTNGFTNTVELPERLDYRTNEVKAETEYFNRTWAIQVGYAGSIFENRVGELVWDNPFRVTDASGNAARGRLDFYPDNTAQSFTIAGAVNLGKSTRLMASIVPGWMRQNDTFLPFTINSTISGVPDLPATSLDGRKQTLAMNYTLTNQSFEALTLTARYRSQDYNNDTPSLIFPAYERTDQSLSAVPRRNLPYGFHRQSLGFDGSWEFWKGHFFKLDYEWERFDREHRDVERATEHTIGAALDLNPRRWMLFRLSYRHADREPGHYEANEDSLIAGISATALGQLHELRKFDEAARTRERAQSLLQLSFTDALSFSASFGTTQDDYKESAYGLLKDWNYDLSFDLTYAPLPELSLFGEYTKEKFRRSQRSRQRVPASATAAANDSTNNDWEGHSRERVDTWGAGINASLFKNRLTADVFYSLSAARESSLTRALGSASLAGFLVTAAQPYPDTNNRYHQVVSSIRLRLADNLWHKLEYRFERYDRRDFQIDRIAPYMLFLDSGTRTSVFLGADVPGYRAHALSFGLEYRF